MTIMGVKMEQLLTITIRITLKKRLLTIIATKLENHGLWNNRQNRYYEQRKQWLQSTSPLITKLLSPSSPLTSPWTQT